MRKLLLPALTLTVGAGLFLAPHAASAQLPEGAASELRMKTGVGWTIVLPDALLGLGAFRMFGRGAWGIYADGHITHGSRKGDVDFLEGETVASIEARLPLLRRELVDEIEEWSMINAGIARAITPNLALTLGGGAARRSVIREYIDRSEEAETSSGLFLVEDEVQSGWQANVIVNALISAGGRIGWMIGFESAPTSFALGVFVTFQ